MTIVHASSLTGSELMSLGNNVLPAVVRDRCRPRTTGGRGRWRKRWQHRQRRVAARAA